MIHKRKNFYSKNLKHRSFPNPSTVPSPDKIQTGSLYTPTRSAFRAIISANRERLCLEIHAGAAAIGRADGVAVYIYVCDCVCIYTRREWEAAAAASRRSMEQRRRCRLLHAPPTPVSEFVGMWHARFQVVLDWRR